MGRSALENPATVMGSGRESGTDERRRSTAFTRRFDQEVLVGARALDIQASVEMGLMGSLSRFMAASWYCPER